MEKNIANLEIKTIPLTQLQGWDKNPCDVIIDRYKTFKETDLGISVIRNGKKLTLEEARNGEKRKTKVDTK